MDTPTKPKTEPSPEPDRTPPARRPRETSPTDAKPRPQAGHQDNTDATSDDN